MKKRLIQIFILVPAAAAGLAVVIAASLQLFLTTDTAGDMLRTRLNDAIAGHVDWEKMEISLFRGRVRLLGIEILDPKARPVITAEELFVDIGLADLLSRRVLVESAIVRKPGIFLETGAGGKINIVSAFSVRRDETGAKPRREKKGAPAMNLRIDRLAIEDGTFSFATTGQHQKARQPVFLRKFDILVADADLVRQSGMLHLSIQDGRVNTAGINIPIDRFSLETTLARGGLDPLEVQLQTEKSRISVSGTVSGLFSRPVTDIRINAETDLSEIRQILALGPEISGRIRIGASVKGDLKNPDIAADLDSDGFCLPGVDFDKVAVRARMQDGQVDIRRIEAGIYGGTITASGLVNLKETFPQGFTALPADLQAVSSDLEIAVSNILFSAVPGMDNARGSISGRINAQSTGLSIKHLAAGTEARLTAAGITPHGSIKPFDMKIWAKTRLEKAVVHLQDINIEADDFQMDLTGRYDIFQNRLDLAPRTDISGPGRLAEQFGLPGVTGRSVTLNADISGHPARPSAKAKITADAPGFRGAAIDRLEAEIGFSGGRLVFSGVNATSRSSTVSLSGKIQLLDPETFRPESDPALDLALDSNQMQLRDFIPSVSGRVQVSANISGSLQNPEGRITAAARGLETGLQSIDAVRLESAIRDRQMQLEPLEITLKPDQSLRIGGWISMDGQYDLKMTSDVIDLAAIKALEQADVKGQAEISAHGAGGFDAPRADALVRLSGLAAEGMPLPDMDIRAGLQDMKATLNVSEPFGLTASHDLAGHDFSVRAQFSDTQLGPFFKLAGMDGFSGSIAGSLKAHGNTRNIENTRADLNISRFGIFFRKQELVSARDFTAAFENREIKIPSNRITLLQEGYITVRGTGGLNRDMDIIAEGAIPAGLASGFVPQIDSPKGRALLSAQISGTIEQPEFSGEIVLEDLGFIVDATLQKIHSVNGRIRVTEKDVTVSGMSGRVDQGEFSINGTVDLENFFPAGTDMNIRARALPLELPGTLELQLDADLIFSGTPGRTALTGDLVLLEGRYFKDVNLSLIDTAGEIGKRRRQTELRAEMPGTDIPFLKNLSLDISLAHRNPFMVDNNLALLTVRPQLALGGTLENPTLTGRAEITQGTVAYRKTEFEVKRGVIDFVDPYRIRPEVDIRAESQVRQWLITLTITGSPENLDFQLSSNPSEEHSDIVSLLATGKTTREMGDSGGGSSPEQMLGRLVTGPLEKQIKGSTGLDIVEVEYGTNGAEAGDGEEVRVTVGKQLSRRLTVKYGVERKSGELVQQSTGIYKLLENLSINAFQDTEGQFGGEMRYRLEFR